LPRPPEEARLAGRRHTKARDAAAIAHHYDVSNDFYRIVLGPSMTYSCAVFASPSTSLEDAQTAKHELICRKLALRPDMRLLDIGCGWGGMLLHAAREHGVRGIGVTVSQRQAELAEKRVAEAGLADRIDIRLQDYRDVDDGPYDAISSIGMFEHVGLSQLEVYFERCYALLSPGARMVNHAIARPAQRGKRPAGRTRFARRSFIDKFVFPDGELHEIGSVVTAMQAQGFEVRHVESIREHYALTLRNWVANLEHDWDDAVAATTIGRARVWRLYMAAAAVNFEDGNTQVHQTLGVKADRGRSGLPLRPRFED
jgi:cyclopropane-fatty-acyl-phospholipid synthase